MNEFPKKIAIIGVGLIGGSIAMGLKKHLGTKIKIIGSCSSFKRSQKSKDMGIIDETIDSTFPLPLNTQLIIIATPIKTIISTLQQISKYSLKKCLVMDVGSTKHAIISEAQKIFPKSITFIGTHPMAGSELSGFENADPNLFRNKPWIVCSKNIKTVSKLIEILGAKMILMNSKRHDKLTSWASHLNLVSSSILINTIGKQKNWTEIAKIASTGFRDTSRLASSNIEMKKDIILTNKDNIIWSLVQFQKEIEIFINLLKNNNSYHISNYLLNAKTTRDSWIENNFS